MKKDKVKNKKTGDDSYFAISRRRRKRYLKIAIPVGVAIAIILGLIFAVEAQQAGLGNKMVLHIHPQLTVTQDGKLVTVPKNIGIDQSLYKDHSLARYGLQGEAPLHTHDENGTIHVESNTNRNYTLGEFLNIWGGLDLNGKTVKLAVDGKPITSDYRNLILQDGQKITLEIKT
jgi:hypothetical protein